MAIVFRRELTRYILNGEWVEVGRGRNKRRILRGERVAKGTPGAEAYVSQSREWYGLVRGKYVKLQAERDKSERQLRKLLSDADDLKFDRFAAHRQTPLAEHIVKFRGHLEAKGRADRYVNETIARLKIAFEHCTRLEHVTADRIDACLNDLAKQGRGMLKKKKCGANESTRNSYLTAAKNFCQWCVRTNRLPDNPLAHVSKLNERVDVRHRRRVLTEAEFGRLIRAAETSTEIVRELSGPDRAMLYLLAVTSGFRASELASLTSDSLQLGDPPVVTVEAAYSKRRRPEAQPIPTWLAERLRVWLTKRPAVGELWVEFASELLWPGSWRRHAAEMIRTDLESAGIDYRDADGRVFDFHALRHHYITTVAKSNSTSVAQRLARHSTPTLTARYTHVALHDTIGAVESLPQPVAPNANELRATGTDDQHAFDEPTGDARVTAQVSSEGQKRRLSSDSKQRQSRQKFG